MKTSISYLLLLLFLTLVNCKPNEKQDYQFTLNGKIIGQDAGTIIIRYKPDSTVVFDTLQIIKGEFVFKGKINYPLEVNLNAGNQLNETRMYIEPGVMNLVLTKDKFAGFKLTGSKTQEEKELLEKMMEPAYKIIQPFVDQISKNIDLINNSPDEAIKKQLEKENEEIEMRRFKTLNDESSKIWLSFVKSHPKSFLVPSYLGMLEQRNYIPFDSLKMTVNKLDTKVKESRDGKKLLNYIRIKENTQIGAIAPDFKAVDSNNQPLTLSQFKGKNVVLIELWASWCGPCLKGFPYLKTIHSKYHPKGFEIIAVTLDQDKKTWLSAVKEEGIDNWYNMATQFRQGESLNNNIFQNYPSGPIPKSFLIDKEGKIIGSWGFYSKANEEELDKILDKLLINNAI